MESVQEKPDIWYYLKQYKDFWRLNMTYDIEQIDKLFAGKREHWFSFLDLKKEKDSINKIWWEQFFSKLDKEVKDTGNWKHELIDPNHCRWYIREFGPESFCLFVFIDGNNFLLSLGSFCRGTINKDLTLLLKKEENGEPLKRTFDRIDKFHLDGENASKYMEKCKFLFDGTEIDNVNRQVWYAHYEPEKLLQQIIVKIKKFTEDPSITEIITHINREIMKQQ
jgi:hypothetical protein